ncbi:hypothetical protein QR680_016163 [Steinernema hermaphroditum]|uniref:BPTI/Kunitz inhibitor domain-containing protein n=1 Tax=Steinernema hermaphroditum TaxID=289476 RepID=A0AA39HCT3_9BILA|nr:hypothetical protein QR680_016163 [Steinernema hermaphroditum]
MNYVVFVIFLAAASGAIIRKRRSIAETRQAVESGCSHKLSPSYLYRSFSMPFYSFDPEQRQCALIYGVGARRGAPNVFFSYKSCLKHCCPRNRC